jgi:hypothetical protein
MWVVDHEADVASDLSAFHRVDDPMTLDGPRYFSLALRLAAYAGVVQAIALETQRREKEGYTPSSGVATGGTVTRVSDTAGLAMADDWIERKIE